MQALSSAAPEEPITEPQTTYGSSTIISLALFDQFYVSQPRRWLLAFLIAYLLAAFSYAALTPAWQSPDEPAHYNYVAHIAQQRSLPVLQEGDYDQRLLEVLLASRFSPMFATSDLRYESYQPPLYYLTATPVFWLANGRLFWLRLYNIFLGLVSLFLLYRCVELVFPDKTMLGAGAIAFAATLPMHVAMTASVNNDGLAGLLILAAMLVLLKWMRDQFYGRMNLDDQGQI